MNQARSAAKLRKMNAPALARKEVPHLVPRPRGKLHWETDVAADVRRQRQHDGDPDEFARYLEEHRERLEAKAQALRDAASAGDSMGTTMLPLSITEWMTWKDQNRDYFEQQLREAPARRRSKYKSRVKASFLKKWSDCLCISLGGPRGRDGLPVGVMALSSFCASLTWLLSILCATLLEAIVGECVCSNHVAVLLASFS